MLYISAHEKIQAKEKQVRKLKPLKFKELPGIEFAAFQELDSKNWNITEQEFGLKIIEKDKLTEAKKFIIENVERILNSLEQLRKNPPKNMRKIPLVNQEQEEKMPSKLMKPLFINGMYNKEGKRIRVNYLKTIGEYPLWIEAGKPNKDYTKNENDKYYLYVEHNGWIVTMGLTEYDLEQKTGYEQLLKEWYGDYQGREKYFQDNFYSGKTYEEYSPLISRQIESEEAFINHAGKNETYQYQYLKNSIDACISRYINARDNNGKFADFIGALFVGELDQCEKIAMILRKEREEEELKKSKLRQEQKEKEKREQEQAEQKLIKETEKIFITGGTIKNSEVIIKIADKHGIDIPIRTRGWILNNLSEATITEDGSVNYRYLKRSKNAKGSQTVFNVLYNIKKAIKTA